MKDQLFQLSTQVITQVFFFEIALVFPCTEVLLSIYHFLSKNNHRIFLKMCTEMSRINTISNFYNIKGFHMKVYFLCVLCMAMKNSVTVL